MALTEREAVDQIEVVGSFKHIQVRCATIIERDGVELSRSFHRHVVSPGDDLSSQSADVQAIAAVVHTPAVIAAYQTHLAASQIGGV
jgi:hypothetical protein